VEPKEQKMIAVTGASGHLGRLVIESLAKKVSPSEIVAAARNPEKVADLASKGIAVRLADYSRPETLGPAFACVEKLLLISGSEVGRRVEQHKSVVAAAKQAGVKLILYTSLLHADRSPLLLGEEHRQSEAAVGAAGIPFVLLRHSWYNENYTGAILQAAKLGVHYGCAGEGRISAASRADYADAAVAVLTAKENPSGRTYELGGDEGFTLAQFAAEIARQSRKAVRYQDLPETEYKTVLVKAGLPEPVAGFFANTDTGISKGALYDDSRQLSALIGRPTTPMSRTIAAVLAS
jgi:NAD(P)H dehydrogenase (quinone)